MQGSYVVILQRLSFKKIMIILAQLLNAKIYIFIEKYIKKEP